MSRIYQGGGADRRYQSTAKSKKYKPTTATGNSKAIKEEGNRIIQDLETKNRERRRNNEMSNLETSYSNKSAQLDQEMERLAELGQLKLNQMKAEADLRMAQLGEQNALKTDQAFAKASFDVGQSVAKANLSASQNAETGKLKIGQLVEQTSLASELQKNKAVLELEQTQERAELEAKQTFKQSQLAMKQTVAKAGLNTKQTADAAKFEQNQLADSQNRARSQMLERNALAQAANEENFLLGVQFRGQQAQFAVDRAQLQAEQTVQRANNQLLQTAVSSLIDFGLQYYFEDKKQKDKAQAQADQRAPINYLFSPQGAPINTETGEPNPVIAQEKQLQDSEVIVEAAIQAKAGGNPIVAENIRQPLADATKDRHLRQATIGEAAINFKPHFDDIIGRPETLAMVNGELRTLASINNRVDLKTWLRDVAVQLTAAFGVDGRDAHEMVMQYGTAATSAIQTAYSDLADTVAANAKDERWEAGLKRVDPLLHRGRTQAAWESARSAYISSGLAMGKTEKQINDAVFGDLLARTPTHHLPALERTLKIPGQAGTEFGDQLDYQKLIKQEKIDRLKLDNQLHTQKQSAVKAQIANITNAALSAQMNTTDPEETLRIGQDAIAKLTALGSPLALDDINKFAKAGKSNNNLYLGFLDKINSGEPFSTAEVMEAFHEGGLTPEQKDDLMERGMRSDEIAMAISKSGLPPVIKQLESKVTQILQGEGVDAAERKGLAAGIVANKLPAVEAELRAFIINKKGEATGVEIQQEAARILDKVGNEIYDKKNPDDGRLKKNPDTGLFHYKYDTETVPPLRRNPTTGKAQRDYQNHGIDNIPEYASVNDVLINRDEFLKAVEVWERGGSDYSDRIKKLAAKVGGGKFSTTAFVRKQAVALGYPSIENIPGYGSRESPTDELQD